jgi:molybdopterin adenylyltransferase
VARLLLFAAVREAAGCREADVTGSSVGEALLTACERFGPAFERLLRFCTVLVDEEPVARSAAWSVVVGERTEIALLPPVSGGEGPLSALTDAHDTAAGRHAEAERVRVAVLTVSDRSAAGSRADAAGPRVAEVASASGAAGVATGVVPDDRHRIEARLRAWADQDAADVILTTGGTGLAPRDVTPEATRAVIDRELPGLPELMRSTGCRTTPFAALSRQVAGLGAPPSSSTCPAPRRGRPRASRP